MLILDTAIVSNYKHYFRNFISFSAISSKDHKQGVSDIKDLFDVSKTKGGICSEGHGMSRLGTESQHMCPHYVVVEVVPEICQ